MGGNSDCREERGHFYGVQVLQLLVRALGRSAAWVEDELHSVVLPLTGACAVHPSPLVRLGCLQALKSLIKSSYGHLSSFRKHIEVATRTAVEDRKREVRLMAVACLNSWQCGLAAE